MEFTYLICSVFQPTYPRLNEGQTTRNSSGTTMILGMTQPIIVWKCLSSAITLSISSAKYDHLAFLRGSITSGLKVKVFCTSEWCCFFGQGLSSTKTHHCWVYCRSSRKFFAYLPSLNLMPSKIPIEQVHHSFLYRPNFTVHTLAISFMNVYSNFYRF